MCHYGNWNYLPTLLALYEVKAVFHWRPIESELESYSEAQSDTFWWKSNCRSRKQNTDSAYDSVATIQWNSEAEAEEFNQSQCSIPSIVIGWFFRFCFRLRQSSFHWIISDGVMNGVRRKWSRSDSFDSDSVSHMIPLTTPIFDFD